MRLVVIGGNATGLSGASKVRRERPDFEIVVYEKTDEISYSQCGMPYYVGGLYDDKETLFVKTPEDFQNDNIDVKIFHEIIDIDFDSKKVKVKDLKNGKVFEDIYDYLLIATGAKAKIPEIDGIGLQNIHVLKHVSDAAIIREQLENKNIKDVVIVGGGYVGLEVAESMVEQGKNVRIIHRPKRLMEIADEEFSDIIEEHLHSYNIKVHKEESLEKIIGDGKVQKVKTDKGEYPCDLLVLSIGVAPNTGFIKDQDIKMEKGIIVTDRYGRTSKENVYSGGDCTYVYNRIKDDYEYIPLGTYANKMGRVCGINISGGNTAYRGGIGTSVVKILDLTYGKTGITDKDGEKLGLSLKSKMITTYSHAKTYPGSEKIHIKLFYDEKKIYGVQMIGKKGVAKRLDIFVLAIEHSISLEDLNYADLCYAPPYATPWEAVNIAAGAINEN